jgi:hypothetical protein
MLPPLEKYLDPVAQVDDTNPGEEQKIGADEKARGAARLQRWATAGARS